MKNLKTTFVLGMLLSFLLVLVACGESQQAQYERQQAEQRAAEQRAQFLEDITAFRELIIEGVSLAESRLEEIQDAVESRNPFTIMLAALIGRDRIQEVVNLNFNANAIFNRFNSSGIEPMPTSESVLSAFETATRATVNLPSLPDSPTHAQTVAFLDGAIANILVHVSALHDAINDFNDYKQLLEEIIDRLENE